MGPKTFAVVLAGGCGERFWPLSTPERPKQFIKIFGGKSLLRQAVERVLPLIPIENVLIVTSSSLARLTQAELPELPKENIICEPCRKNTAPAIGTALGVVRHRGGENASVAVLTADQLIERSAVFRKCLRQALQTAAKQDVIVTLGIRPKFPSTAFGYIDAKRKVFVEKPDVRRAEKYFKAGCYVWNAGMFMFRANVLQLICREVAPEIAALSDRVAKVKNVNGFLRRVYPTLTSISFDYAVMEKTRSIGVVAGDFGWDDVGSYATLTGHLPEDKSGNIRLGTTRQLDCSGCILLSQGAKVSAFGLRDVVVATCGDEVLVMPKACAADLKRLLSV